MSPTLLPRWAASAWLSLPSAPGTEMSRRYRCQPLTSTYTSLPVACTARSSPGPLQTPRQTGKAPKPPTRLPSQRIQHRSSGGPAHAPILLASPSYAVLLPPPPDTRLARSRKPVASPPARQRRPLRLVRTFLADANATLLVLQAPARAVKRTICSFTAIDRVPSSSQALLTKLMQVVQVRHLREQRKTAITPGSAC